MYNYIFNIYIYTYNIYNIYILFIYYIYHVLYPLFPYILDKIIETDKQQPMKELTHGQKRSSIFDVCIIIYTIFTVFFTHCSQGRTGTENRPGQFPTTTLPAQPWKIPKIRRFFTQNS